MGKNVIPCPNKHESPKEVLEIDCELSCSNDILCIDDGDNLQCCTICLEAFQINDEVSWSRSNECQHVFHHNCILPWLASHSECPCCRDIIVQNDMKDAASLANCEKQYYACCVDHGLIHKRL